MNTEQKLFLVEASEELFIKIQNLNNRINETLDTGEKYAFVLCKAKIAFIQSLINDIMYCITGQVPDVVVESTIEAVKFVEQNFSSFLGTCSSDPAPKLVQVSPEKAIEISRRMAHLMSKGTNNEPFTEA